MNIATKYNIGDTAYKISESGNLLEVTISTIHIKVTSNYIAVRYHDSFRGASHDEEDLYSTREECATKWLTSQGLSANSLLNIKP